MFGQTVRQFLQPIAPFLDDESVSEVMINGHDKIYIERKGKVALTSAKFTDEAALLSAMRNIAQFVGRTLNEENPRMDARLPDGSRVHAVIEPIAKQGVTVAIRKFSQDSLTPEKLIEFGAITPHMMDFLKACVRMEKNLIVSGGTGSGKTSLLNLVTGFVEPSHRTLIAEDSAEMQPRGEHIVKFESRPADKHGRGQVTIRDLIHSALRLRPDRVVIGEIRGGEALDLLQAMNTGHGGSMATVHANDPMGALNRLETLSMFAGLELPVSALRAQVSSAIDVIVQTNRFHDGSRKITHLSEILPLDEYGKYQTRDIFTFVPDGVDEKTHKIVGAHKPTGEIPSFLSLAISQGFPLTEEYFDPNYDYTPEKSVVSWLGM
jgi:pilus assembly protein CpaF